MSQVDNNLAVLILAKRLKELDDANPDVGFPPMWWMHVDDALAQLQLTKEDVDYEKLCNGE
jgi:hypothetical protein